MTPDIKKSAEKKLVGLKLKMSLIDNKTGQLWGRFGPLIKSIPNKVSQDKISMQIYGAYYYSKFDPGREFEKWATVEVENFDAIPKELDRYILQAGDYAVFDYKGSSSDYSIYQYIFWEWLPKSNFQIDDRPHFEVLGAKYKNNDPDSEEEIWIPIKNRE